MKKAVIVTLIAICIILMSVSYLHAQNKATGTREAAPLNTDSEEKVAFNFVGVELASLVRFVSELTGKNVIFDETLKGKVTVVAPSPLNKADAFRLFTAVLELKGYTVITSGSDTYKIIQSAVAKQKGIDMAGEEMTVNETYVARLIKLENLSAEDAVKFLRPIVSKDGYIGEFSARNVILVIDTGPNVDKILSIVKSIDSPSTVDQPDVVMLVHGGADVVANIINDGLKKGVTVQTPKGVTPTVSPNTFVAADKRLNAVIIFGPKTEREPLRRLIMSLDVPAPAAGGMINVIFLENANAVELAKVLENLIKATTTQQATAQGGAQATQGAAAKVTPFMASGEILITPDESTNSLIVIASQADYSNILAVIKQLDRKRKQVYVEAMIVEVSLDDAMELGAKWRAMAKDNDEPRFVGGVGTISSSTMSDILYGMSGLGIGGLGSFVNVPVSVTSSDGTSTTQTLSVPGYAAVFNVSDLKNVINVLSTPQILTSDNKEAEIIVGENVPFITKRESDASRSLSVFSSIERKDVGITLKITPHITEGEYLKLDVYQEISSVKNESNSEVLISMGPTTTKRSTKSTIFAKNAETVVIGGLMQETTEESIEKVPLLGDIPVLGWLFKHEGQKQKKINLLIFLTPHIIADSVQLQSLTSEKRMTLGETMNKEATEDSSPQLLVRFKDDTDKSACIKLLSASRALVVREFDTTGLYLVTPAQGENIEAVKKTLESLAEVKYVEEPGVLNELKGK